MALPIKKDRIHEGAYLVYINGIEIPAASVSAQFDVGSVPSISISLPPDPTLTRLGAEDKVHVVIFYLDDTYSALQGRPPDFRRLCEGTIEGWSYSNSAMGRSLSFQCQDLLGIMGQMNLSFITGADSMTMAAMKAQGGNEQFQTSVEQLLPIKLLMFGTDDKAENPVKRPYDFVLNALRSFVDVKSQQQCKSIPAINFFGRFFRRMNMVRRFMPSPILEIDPTNTAHLDTSIFPIMQGVQNHQVIQVLAQQAASMGNNTSILALITRMFMEMFYELAVIPAAPIAQVDMDLRLTRHGDVLGEPKWNKPPAGDIAKLVAAGKLSSQIAGVPVGTDVLLNLVNPEALKPNFLFDYVSKPQWIFGVAPTCNILFPSMIKTIQYEEGYANQPTRLYASEKYLGDIISTEGVASEAFRRFYYGYPKQVQVEMDKRYGADNITWNPMVSGTNLLVWPEEYFRGPQRMDVNIPMWLNYVPRIFDGKDAAKVAALQVINQVYSSAGTDIDKMSRLKTNKDTYWLLTDLLHYPQTAEGAAKYLAEVKHKLEHPSSVEQPTERALKNAVARTEYYRARGQARSGTIVTAFNPYIVPGFPTVVFDALDSGQHFIAYVVSVTHTLSPSGMETVIRTAYGQTLEEFVSEVYDARAAGALTAGAGPKSPIESISNVTQTVGARDAKTENAEAYFAKLLHQNKNYGEDIKRCAFDFAEVVRFVMPSGEERSFDEMFETMKVEANKNADTITKLKEQLQKDIVQVRTDVTNELSKSSQEDVAAQTQSQSQDVSTEIAIQAQIDERVKTQTDELTKTCAAKIKAIEDAVRTAQPSREVFRNYVSVKPSPKFAPLFEDYEQAMRFVARPVCTLDEYIKFRGQYGLSQGVVAPNHPSEGRGAKYYQKILNLRQGPGDSPIVDINNQLLSPVPRDLADTRLDWETKLWEYRRRMLFGKVTNTKPGTDDTNG